MDKSSLTWLWPGRWFRIPLPGNVDGIVVMLPAKPLTHQEWDYAVQLLAAMKPGLVSADETPSKVDRHQGPDLRK